MRYFTDAWAKYAVFRGRANRRQFWIFMLIAWLINAAVIWLTGGRDEMGNISFIAWLTGALFVLPALSVTVRRLHDTDHSGWWWWIGAVPLIGQLWLFVLMVLPGTYGPNRYGSMPR